MGPAKLATGMYRQITGNAALAYGIVAAGQRSGLQVLLGPHAVDLGIVPSPSRPQAEAGGQPGAGSEGAQPVMSRQLRVRQAGQRLLFGRRHYVALRERQAGHEREPVGERPAGRERHAVLDLFFPGAGIVLRDLVLRIAVRAQAEMPRARHEQLRAHERECGIPALTERAGLRGARSQCRRHHQRQHETQLAHDPPPRTTGQRKGRLAGRERPRRQLKRRAERVGAAGRAERNR